MTFAHNKSECIHGTVVSQCRCPGLKTTIIVPCPESCHEDEVEQFPKLEVGKLMGAGNGSGLIRALQAWIDRAEQSYPGDVTPRRLIEAIEAQGWRLTYVGKEG